MTVIKIKCDLEKIERCQDCPFVDYYDKTNEYGDLLCWGTYYCRLIDDWNDSIIDDTENGELGDIKLDNCPIISVTYEEES